MTELRSQGNISDEVISYNCIKNNYIKHCDLAAIYTLLHNFILIIGFLVLIIPEMAMGLNRFHEFDRRDSEAAPRARAELDQLRANLLLLRDEARASRQANEGSINVSSGNASKDVGAWDDDSSIENLISAVLERGTSDENEALLLSTSITSKEEISDSEKALDQNTSSVSSTVSEEPSALSYDVGNNDKQQDNDTQFFTTLRAKFRDLYPLLLAVPFAGEISIKLKGHKLI